MSTNNRRTTVLWGVKIAGNIGGRASGNHQVDCNWVSACPNMPPYTLLFFFLAWHNGVGILRVRSPGPEEKHTTLGESAASGQPDFRGPGMVLIMKHWV